VSNLPDDIYRHLYGITRGICRSGRAQLSTVCKSLPPGEISFRVLIVLGRVYQLVINCDKRFNDCLLHTSLRAQRGDEGDVGEGESADEED
jgi:hypothetical protein